MSPGSKGLRLWVGKPIRKRLGVNVGPVCSQGDIHGEALAYLAAGVTAAWGVAPVMPTGRVVAGFGNLSKDNRLILTVDWVAEGFTLVLLGVLVAVVTMRGGSRTR
jgi:hypothetical protein